MDDRINAIMADMAPSSWAEGERRLAVIRRYAQGETKSAAEAERLARELGLGRSMFYRLVRAFKDYAEPPPGGQSGPHGTTQEGPAEAIDDAVAEAIARSGTFATQANVLRLATSICRARGVPPPRPRMVRRAFIGELAGRRLDAHFGVEAERALDRCQLDLVVSADDAPRIAQLACLVDLHRGEVVHHVVTAGPPAAEDVATLLHPVGEPCSVAVSESDTLMHELSTVALKAGDSRPPQLSRWRMGAVVRASLGLRLGRVKLLERVPDSLLSLEPIDLASAREVIAELFQRTTPACGPAR